MITDKLAQVNTSPQNPYTQKVRVTKLTPTHQAGTIKAFVTIQIGEALEIRGCKVIQQPNQKVWVSLPDRKNEDGVGYFPIVKCLDERLKTAITVAVLAAWEGAQ